MAERKKRRTKKEIEEQKALEVAESMQNNESAKEKILDEVVAKTIQNTKVFNVTVLFKSGTKITLDNYFEFAKDEEENLWKGHPSEITENMVLEIKDEYVAAVIFAESIISGGKRKQKRR